MLWDIKQGLSGNIPRWCWWLEQYPNKHRLCILTSHCTNQKLGIVTWKEMLVSLLISSPPTVAKLSFCHFLSWVDIPVRPWENSRWICDVFHLEHPRDSHLADVCAFVRVIFTWRGLRHPSTSFLHYLKKTFCNSDSDSGSLGVFRSCCRHLFISSFSLLTIKGGLHRERGKASGLSIPIPSLWNKNQTTV